MEKIDKIHVGDILERLKFHLIFFSFFPGEHNRLLRDHVGWDEIKCHNSHCTSWIRPSVLFYLGNSQRGGTVSVLYLYSTYLFRWGIGGVPL